ncbi:DNA topoisomerase 1 [Nakaseomyces bracarensis]|uniref:DNA topoisomerase I n=1 Tax=Nakaseomyces bracarensis TaxID=273131 RepID=A0ABR4NTG7_9SACH
MTVSDDEGVVYKRRRIDRGIKEEDEEDVVNVKHEILNVKEEAVNRSAGNEDSFNNGEIEKKIVKTLKEKEALGDGKLEEVQSEDEEVDEVEKEEEEEEEEEYKWWEEQDKDDTIKWTTLIHNGVLFPPEYEPLPSHVKLYYDGKPVDLPVQAEEVAGFYAHLLETTHAKNPIFQKNFFEDFKEVLKESGGSLNNIDIQAFNKCDFSKMHEYFVTLKEQKKNLTAMEKKEIRLEREKFEEKYKICILDGRKEQIGNFKVEPPDLFRGRGAHQKTGKLKRRIYPEDIILNLSKDAPVPPPPAGHKWGEIRHDNTVQWLAMWRENIFGSFKYVRLAANSSLKGQSDFKKFEKARELKNHVERIRRDYKMNLRNRLMIERQKAVAIYIIDVFALRAGGEKSEDEADTVGCCSLRYEHVTLRPPNTVIFDFLGKDSIRYYQEVQVDPKVFKNLALFKKPPKQPGHQLFDRLDPSILNKHLQNYMPGLTAKVFRTYNASKTMQDQLDLIPNEGSVAEKLLKYNAANRTVAILCNHQRTVTAGHAKSVAKSNDKIQELEWQKMRLKKALLQLEPDMAEKMPDFFKDIDSINKTSQAEIHHRILEREALKIQLKFKRENDKRKYEGDELLTEEILKEWMQKVDSLKAQYETELETGNVELRSFLNSAEKILAAIDKIEKRIINSQVQLRDREENSQVSLGTSKINYIDPRLSVVFCKKYDVPIEKIFTKSLREKFKWAIESVDENWRF